MTLRPLASVSPFSHPEPSRKAPKSDMALACYVGLELPRWRWPATRWMEKQAASARVPLGMLPLCHRPSEGRLLRDQSKDDARAILLWQPIVSACPPYASPIGSVNVRSEL